MAGHIRQQIRVAVADKLVGLATTGARVYASRVFPLSDSDLPCLLVFSRNEQVQARSIGSQVANIARNTHRQLALEIKVFAKAGAALDDTLDTICKEVEVCLAADRFLGGLTSDLVLDTTSIELQGDGERPAGVATMIWLAEYWTLDNAPDMRG